MRQFKSKALSNVLSDSTVSSDIPVTNIISSDIPVTNIISSDIPVSNDINDPIKNYIDQLNPLEKIAYDIAKKRLKTSFDIEKSIGYKSK